MIETIQTVEWDVAEEVGGFYFSRARYLGLPLPPRVFVYHDGSDLSEQDQAVIGRYHQLFKDAEENIILSGF